MIFDFIGENVCEVDSTNFIMIFNIILLYWKFIGYVMFGIIRILFAARSGEISYHVLYKAFVSQIHQFRTDRVWKWTLIISKAAPVRKDQNDSRPFTYYSLMLFTAGVVARVTT